MKKDTRGSGIIWAIAAVMILAVVIAGALTFAYYSYNNSIASNKKIQLELEAKAAIDSVVTVLQQGESLSTIVPNVGSTKTLTITLPEDMGTVDKAHIKRETEKKITIIVEVESNLGDTKVIAYMDYIDKNWVLNHYEGGNLS